MRRELDDVDFEIIWRLEGEGPTTISELSRSLGWAKSMVWRRVWELQGMGLVEVRRRGGVTIVYRATEKPVPGRVGVGILRASEYPYILQFIKSLRERFREVRVRVYDEAFRLAVDLASNRVQLAMAPVPTLILSHRISSGRVHIIGGGSAEGASVIYSRRGGAGHATTMASAMEMCAEIFGLEPPRVYKTSGASILEAVERGEVGAGVVWEPYVTMARARGYRAEDCGLPVCCLLGGHESVEEHYDWASGALSDSIARARSRGADLDAYSRLVGMPRGLLEASMSSYQYYEDLPGDVLKRYWGYIVRSIVPGLALSRALRG